MRLPNGATARVRPLHVEKIPGKRYRPEGSGRPFGSIRLPPGRPEQKKPPAHHRRHGVVSSQLTTSGVRLVRQPCRASVQPLRTHKAYYLNNPGGEPCEGLVQVRCVMSGNLRKVQIPPLSEGIPQSCVGQDTARSVPYGQACRVLSGKSIGLTRPSIPAASSSLVHALRCSNVGLPNETLLIYGAFAFQQIDARRIEPDTGLVRRRGNALAVLGTFADDSGRFHPIPRRAFPAERRIDRRPRRRRAGPSNRSYKP